MRPIVINRLSWQAAVSLAIATSQIYRTKQRVYKHPVFGWTWGDAR